MSISIAGIFALQEFQSLTSTAYFLVHPLRPSFSITLAVTLNSMLIGSLNQESLTAVRLVGMLNAGPDGYFGMPSLIDVRAFSLPTHEASNLPPPIFVLIGVVEGIELTPSGNFSLALRLGRQALEPVT